MMVLGDEYLIKRVFPANKNTKKTKVRPSFMSL
jgi:hypothetical protein